MLAYAGLVMLMAISTVSGHEYLWGSCPDVEVLRDFDLERFAGTWYVQQRFRTSSDCIEERIELENGTYFLTERIRPLSAGAYVTQRTKLVAPDRDTPAKLTVNYPLSPFGNSTYWVLATDYTSHALVWSCDKPLRFAPHRQQATILSRSRDRLDREVIQKMRRKLDSFSIDEDSFSLINQSECNSTRSVANENRSRSYLFDFGLMTLAGHVQHEH